MTQQADFLEQVGAVAQKVGAYDVNAYIFVFEALEFTIKRAGERRHVTGKELTEGIKGFALLNFGRMGRVVFEQWGIKDTRDFGKIVFALVEAGLMSKTETDSVEDFAGGFDFKEVFENSYVPNGIVSGQRPRSGKSPKSG